MERVSKSYCRVCGSLCGIEVGNDGDRVNWIRGDKSHPMTKGFMCIKGQMSKDYHNGEDRLTDTLARRPGGKLEKADLESTMDVIADRLGRILDEHGPRSIAIYYGTGSKSNTLGVQVMRSWARAIGTPNFYSSSTVDQSAKWVAAGRTGVFEPGPYNILETDVALFSGINPVLTHLAMPLLPSHAQGKSCRTRESAE